MYGVGRTTHPIAHSCALASHLVEVSELRINSNAEQRRGPPKACAPNVASKRAARWALEHVSHTPLNS
eukprot:3724468-Alexandrium_andersonii.AAC.1